MILIVQKFLNSFSIFSLTRIISSALTMSNAVAPVFGEISVISIIANKILNGVNPDWVDVRKKIILLLFIKLVYDNLTKFYLDPSLFKSIFLMFLQRFSYRLQIQENGPEYLCSDEKLDPRMIEKHLNISSVSQGITYFRNVVSQFVIVVKTGLLIEIFYPWSGFEQRFIEKCRLQNITEIITKYQIVSVNGPKIAWIVPNRINNLLDECKHADFIQAIETFATNSAILGDIATQAYIINGPSGVGKSTVIDILYRKNIFHIILKLNMMNFINFDHDFEEIIDKTLKQVSVKTANEIRLVCFDEIDKWRNHWKIRMVRKYITETKKYQSPEQLKQYSQELDNKFYNTFQRLIDGELLNVPRLVVMCFTNNGETIWNGLTADYVSVRERFNLLEFDYCRVDEVISYLKLMFRKLGKTFNQHIRSDLVISYRKLKALIVLANYQPEIIAQRLNQVEILERKEEKELIINFDQLSRDSFEEIEPSRELKSMPTFATIDIYRTDFENDDEEFAYFWDEGRRGVDPEFLKRFDDINPLNQTEMREKYPIINNYGFMKVIEEDNQCYFLSSSSFIVVENQKTIFFCNSSFVNFVVDGLNTFYSFNSDGTKNRKYHLREGQYEGILKEWRDGKLVIHYRYENGNLIENLLK